MTTTRRNFSSEPTSAWLSFGQSPDECGEGEVKLALLNHFSLRKGHPHRASASIGDETSTEVRVLDVAFDADHCRVRTGNAPENMAMLRHVALNLLKADTTNEGGIKVRRKSGLPARRAERLQAPRPALSRLGRDVVNAAPMMTRRLALVAALALLAACGSPETGYDAGALDSGTGGGAGGGGGTSWCACR
jgi:hypothetical protein